MVENLEPAIAGSYIRVSRMQFRAVNQNLPVSSIAEETFFR